VCDLFSSENFHKDSWLNALSMISAYVKHKLVRHDFEIWSFLDNIYLRSKKNIENVIYKLESGHYVRISSLNKKLAAEFINEESRGKKYD